MLIEGIILTQHDDDDDSFLEMHPGTIVAWVPTEDREPPAHWVICDGRRIEEGPLEVLYPVILILFPV